MRIAITTNTTGAGGAEKQRILLANALVRSGHHVGLAVLQKPGSLHDLLAPEVEVFRISYWRLLPRRFDVVLTGTTNTELTFGLLNRVRGTIARWLTSIHNPVSPGSPRLKILSRALVRLADARIALTPQHASALEQIWGLKAEYIVSNAVEGRASVQHAGSRPSLGRVGYLGRLSIEHKGLDRLLEGMVCSSANGLTLEIAGTGPDEGKVRSMISERGLESRVTMTGFASATDFFDRVDGLVILSRWEAQPMVLLEAALAGVPVVASREVDVSDGVDADDPVAVAAALVALATGRVKAKRGHSRGPAGMASDYLAAFEAALLRRKCRK